VPRRSPLRSTVAALAVVALAVAGCGDDDGTDDAELAAFCAQLEDGDTLVPGFAGANEVSRSLVFFQQLREAAPDEIDGELATVIDGLDALDAAFAEYQGLEGEAALDAVTELADVDVDELAGAAAEVERYAAERCEEVTVGTDG
jgi:hypothetical protein